MQNNSNQKNGLSWSSPSPASSQKTAPASMVSSAKTGSPSSMNHSHTATYAGLVVAGVVAGILIGWGITNMGDSSSTTGSATTTPNTSTNTSGTVTTTTTGATGSPAIGSDPSLVILTPQAAGTEVVVTKTIVAEPTWVVVYESRNGAPGNILGAALFFPERQAGTVQLLRGTVAGQTYFVGKRTDDGDRKFSMDVDNPLLEGGQSMLVQFVAN